MTPTPAPPWLTEPSLTWLGWLLDSHRQLLGEELLPRYADPLTQAEIVFSAPQVVVSHRLSDDPILCYGNQQALDLWEMSWEQLTSIPSRLTAEADAREERARMLTAAREQGFFRPYEGIRISARGRRFRIEEAVIWSVRDHQGQPVGQAASFERWTRL